MSAIHSVVNVFVMTACKTLTWRAFAQKFELDADVLQHRRIYKQCDILSAWLHHVRGYANNDVNPTVEDHASSLNSTTSDAKSSHTTLTQISSNTFTINSTQYIIEDWVHVKADDAFWLQLLQHILNRWYAVPRFALQSTDDTHFELHAAALYTLLYELFKYIESKTLVHSWVNHHQHHDRILIANAWNHFEAHHTAWCALVKKCEHFVPISTFPFQTSFASTDAVHSNGTVNWNSVRTHLYEHRDAQWHNLQTLLRVLALWCGYPSMWTAWLRPILHAAVQSDAIIHLLVHYVDHWITAASHQFNVKPQSYTTSVRTDAALDWHAVSPALIILYTMCAMHSTCISIFLKAGGLVQLWRMFDEWFTPLCTAANVNNAHNSSNVTLALPLAWTSKFWFVCKFWTVCVRHLQTLTHTNNECTVVSSVHEWLLLHVRAKVLTSSQTSTAFETVSNSATNPIDSVIPDTISLDFGHSSIIPLTWTRVLIDAVVTRIVQLAHAAWAYPLTYTRGTQCIQWIASFIPPKSIYSHAKDKYTSRAISDQQVRAQWLHSLFVTHRLDVYLWHWIRVQCAHMREAAQSAADMAFEMHVHSQWYDVCAPLLAQAFADASVLVPMMTQFARIYKHAIAELPLSPIEVTINSARHGSVIRQWLAVFVVAYNVSYSWERLHFVHRVCKKLAFQRHLLIILCTDVNALRAWLGVLHYKVSESTSTAAFQQTLLQRHWRWHCKWHNVHADYRTACATLYEHAPTHWDWLFDAATRARWAVHRFVPRPLYNTLDLQRILRHSAASHVNSNVSTPRNIQRAHYALYICTLKEQNAVLETLRADLRKTELLQYTYTQTEIIPITQLDTFSLSSNLHSDVPSNAREMHTIERHKLYAELTAHLGTLTQLMDIASDPDAIYSDNHKNMISDIPLYTPINACTTSTWKTISWIVMYMLSVPILWVYIFGQSTYLDDVFE